MNEPKPRRKLWHPTWFDIAGAMGIYIFIDATNDAHPSGVLAGAGTFLFLLASGGPRGWELLVRLWERRRS